jgi:hypothetical protein
VENQKANYSDIFQTLPEINSKMAIMVIFSYLAFLRRAGEFVLMTKIIIIIAP